MRTQPLVITMFGWGCEWKPRVSFRIDRFDGGAVILIDKQAGTRQQGELLLTTVELAPVDEALEAASPTAAHPLDRVRGLSSVGSIVIGDPPEAMVDDGAPHRLQRLADLLCDLAERAGVAVDPSCHPIAASLRA